MVITSDRSVAEIAVGFTGSIPLFEAWGIDYCCGGARSLKEACETKGLDTATVTADLQAKATAQAPDEEVDWVNAPLPSLIDHLLEKHHAYTREQTRLAGNLAEKVARVHGERHTFLAELKGLVDSMGSELEDHMRKEEQVLFPLLRRLDGSGVSSAPGPVLVGPIRVMMGEHEAVGEQLKRMRALTGGLTPPEDACNSFRALYRALGELEADLHRHIHLENNVLFERAKRNLWA